MKKCAMCKKTKPLNEFCNDKSSRDGKRYICRTCNRYQRTHITKPRKQLF